MADALEHPCACEYNGVLYVIGYRDGGQYLRRSLDGGKSWVPFRDGSEERLVAEPASAQRAGLVKVDCQGRGLLAAVATGQKINVYLSRDDGETWELEGEC